ncbi:hypothetical protein C4579_01815 [Candidatus Microgenomates bacterium]|nr:MAG: hypothetical protein C4579_01815 [Candidatus Microgenomates bacterium]
MGLSNVDHAPRPVSLSEPIHRDKNIQTLAAALDIDQLVYMQPFNLGKQGDRLIARSAASLGLMLVSQGRLDKTPIDLLDRRNRSITVEAFTKSKPLDLWSAVFEVAEQSRVPYDPYRDASESNFQYSRRVKQIVKAYTRAALHNAQSISSEQTHLITRTTPLLLPDYSGENHAMVGFDYRRTIQLGKEFRRQQRQKVMYFVEAGSTGKRFLPHQVVAGYKQLRAAGVQSRILSDRAMTNQNTQVPEYEELIAEGQITRGDLLFPKDTTEMAGYFYAADGIVLTDSFPKWLAAGAISMRPDRPVTDYYNRTLFPKSHSHPSVITDILGTLQYGDLFVFYGQSSPGPWQLTNEDIFDFSRPEYQDLGQSIRDEDALVMIQQVIKNKLGGRHR